MILPVILTASTLLVRWRLSVKDRRGWFLDLATVPLWTWFYISAEAWPLLVIPYVFAFLDVKALRGAWRQG